MSETCVHHWVVETPSPKARMLGVCRKCWAEREFRKDGGYEKRGFNNASKPAEASDG